MKKRLMMQRSVHDMYRNTRGVAVSVPPTGRLCLLHLPSWQGPTVSKTCGLVV